MLKVYSFPFIYRLRLRLAASMLASALLCVSCGGGGGSATDTPPGNGQTTASLSVSTAGNGSVVSEPAGIDCGATCQASYTAGSSVNLTAKPAASYSFSGWGGACSGSATVCTVLMTEARNVTAAFVPNDGSAFALNVSTSGSGSVTSQPVGISCGATCSTLFTASTTVTLTATPAAGQVFSAWTGDCAGATSVCVLRMNSSKSAQAVFVTPQTAGWQDQVLVSAAGTDQHGFQRTAMASDGRVLAIWLQQVVVNSQITGYIVWQSRYTPDSNWTIPTEVTRVASSMTLHPYRLAMNATGKGVLAWSEIRANTTTTFDITAMPFDLATGWGQRSVISATTTQSAQLDASVDTSGNAMVTWIQLNFVTGQSLRAVWANHYTVSGTWGTAKMLNDTVDDGANNPAVAVTSGGDALVVWRGYGLDTGISGIWTRKYTASGSWGAASLLVPRTGTRYDLSSFPTIAADSNGGAMLVWLQIDLLSNPTLFQRAIWSQRYVNGAWTGTPIMLSTPITGTPASSTVNVIPAIAFNAQNRAAVSWIPPEEPKRVWVNRSRSDGTWETPQTINVIVSTVTVSNPGVGLDDQGNMTAAWLTSANIMTNRYTEGSGWSAEQAMATFDPFKGVVGAASLANNGKGDAVLVYQMNPDPLRQGSQIFSRYFKAQP
jgi:Divergent InlB B-repeat domain